MNFTTMAGDALTSCLINGAVMRYDANALLNTKFNVLPNERPASNVYPINNLLFIGNGGTLATTDANSGLLTVGDYDRYYTMTALFNHIPVICRLASNDLSAAQRARYAMRVVKLIGGVSYVFYYAFRISFATSEITYTAESIVNGVVTASSDYSPLATDLNPTVSAVTGSGLTVLSNNYMVTSLAQSISLSASDAAEIYNACAILYNGDTSKANITEWGIAASVNYAQTLADTTTFNEAIVAMITTISTDVKQVITPSTGVISLALNGGTTAPILQTKSS